MSCSIARVACSLAIVAMALLATIPAAEAGEAPPATPAASLCAGVRADATPGASLGGHGMTGAMMGTPGAGMGMMRSDQFDLMLIDMMIAHDERAAVMATVALERGEHEEIRESAGEILATQTAEIEQLRSWRDAWYPGAPEMAMARMAAQMTTMIAALPDMPMLGVSSMLAGMDAAGGLIALCNAPEPFDLAFIDAVIAHDEGVIAMANVALDNASRQELIDFSQGVIDARQSEIDQLRGWRDAWFPSATPVSP